MFCPRKREREQKAKGCRFIKKTPREALREIMSGELCLGKVLRNTDSKVQRAKGVMTEKTIPLADIFFKSVLRKEDKENSQVIG